MKKTALLFGLCLTIRCILSGQNYAADFGKFNIEEVRMTSYPADKIAEAVVLYDIGNTFFTHDADNGFLLTFERSTKIKILSKAGLKYAEVEIPYYREFDKQEKVYDIEGYTYNLEDGFSKISKFDPKNVFEEKHNEHWTSKKFAMPDVKEGSVLEFRYKIESPYYFNFHDWDFQSRIPEVYSEYTARMIPFFEYTYILQGASKFDYFKNKVGDDKKSFGIIEYPENIFTFGMKNIPAFRDEEYITSINDYILKLDFQLSVIHHPNGGDEPIMTTWPLLIQELLKENAFGIYMKSAGRNAEDIITALDIGSKTTAVKAETIFKYVRSNYNWNGTKDKFAGKSAKEFLRSKTGNSAEMNLFLCAMLNEAGIQAYPVLLSTRDHGKIQAKYPFHHFMNYVIVQIRIDDKDILLDATEPLSPFGMLPSRCINDKGLVVKKDNVDWIPLVDSVVSESTDTVHILLSESLDTAFLDCHLSAIGHKGLDYRREYQSEPKDFKKEFIREGMEFKSETEVKNTTHVDLPFIYNYSVHVPVESVGNKLLVEPFPGLVPLENPLKLPFRSYPVDMVYKNKHSFAAYIPIPKGYRYVEQDKILPVNNDLVGIQYKIENAEGVVKVIGSYEFKRPVYQKYEYYDLKNFLAKIIETFNGKIVFERL
jgi:hypothetical protein